MKHISCAKVLVASLKQLTSQNKRKEEDDFDLYKQGPKQKVILNHA